ncbi:hypothetical protein [Vibrio zhugei]|nr:hypothetical protein [Vibrio zhugei]
MNYQQLTEGRRDQISALLERGIIIAVSLVLKTDITFHNERYIGIIGA